MSLQQTLIIVKPDGIAKGLVGQILQSLESNNLRVIDSIRLHIERRWAEDLYRPEEHAVYFTEVVEWISSSPVLFMRIEGEEAVPKVKWQIIGRYPNGIRGQYSENWIKNVAHAPDSTQSAVRELGLSESMFERKKVMNKEKLKDKMVFALTGMSECGKSTAGRYLDSKGIKRLKIVKLFEEVRNKLSPGEELHAFIQREEARDPYALWDAFIDELLQAMDSLAMKTVSIESLYGGGLGPYLMQKLDEHFCIIYIDMPQVVRVRRQMQRENLTSVEEAEKMIIPRDEIKEKSGIPHLKAIAGEVVDNSGTLPELYRAIDAIVERHVK